MPQMPLRAAGGPPHRDHTPIRSHATTETPLDASARRALGRGGVPLRRRGTRAALVLALGLAALAGCARDEPAGNAAVDSALARDLALAAQVSPDFVPNDAPMDAPTTLPTPSASAPAPRATPRPAPPAPAPRPRPRPAAPERTVERQRPAPQPAPAPVEVAEREPERQPEPAAGSPAPSDTPAPAGAGERGAGLAAGTAIGLATNQRVCTNSNLVGDKLTATVSGDVVGTGGVIIPSGSKAVLEVASIQQGKTPAETRITFRVRALYDGTRPLPITGDVSAGEQLEKVRTTAKGTDAKKVIGGAIAGAILGQVIGKDTKGTVIGGAAGAAAGAAAAKITEKWEGCLPVGAPLRLVLSERVDLAAR